MHEQVRCLRYWPAETNVRLVSFENVSEPRRWYYKALHAAGRYLDVSRPYLCSQCQFYDKHFERLFEPRESSTRVDDWRDLKSYRTWMPVRRCALCKALAKLVLSSTDRKYSGSLLVPSLKDEDADLLDDCPANRVWIANLFSATTRQTSPDYPVASYSMGLVLERGSSEKEGKVARRNRKYSHHDAILLPMQGSGTWSAPYSAQAINRARANFEAIKTWIEACSQNHEKCKIAAEVGRDIDILVLDCVIGSVVPRPYGMAYVTLSYVWGNHRSAESLRSFDGKRAARVIRDAMVITRRLGYRFLWVDQYCIDQSDEAVKMRQIRHMDMIYENSDLTIVAASSPHDEVGLPGAGTQPYVLREPSTTIKLGSRTLVSTRPGVEEALHDSKWLTRGWTYQEAVLSRRCLFFTSSQVFLACNTTTRSEVLPQTPTRSKYELEDRDTTIESLVGSESTFNRTSLEWLQDRIGVYLQRDLSLQRDSINAFRAILSRAPFRSYWGVPLLHYVLPHSEDSYTATGAQKDAQTEQAFLNGLCWETDRHKVWRNTTNAERRVDNPTWSWCSLHRGSIRFHQDPDNKETSDCFYITRSPNTKVSVSSNNLTIRSSLTWTTISEVAKMSTDRLLAEFRPLLQLQALVADVSLVEIHPDPGFSLATSEYSHLAPHTDFNYQGRVRLFTHRYEHDRMAYIPVTPDSMQFFTKGLDYSRGRGEFRPIAWRIARITETRNMIHKDGVSRPLGGRRGGWVAFYLVLKEIGGFWQRIGAAVLSEDIQFDGLRQETMIVA